MGPWADAIVTVAAVAAAFFAVLGFRGLMETVDHDTSRCTRCGRFTLWPPPESHACWRCHYASSRVAAFMVAHWRVRH